MVSDRPRRPYVASLGVVLCVGIMAALALATPAAPVLLLRADAGPCGTTGILTVPTTCTYTTSGSGTFTVPAGVVAVDIVAVGAQGGHYFIAGDAAHGGSPAGDLIGRPGGNGGQAAGTLTGLTPGQVLQVDVASKGTNGTAASRSGGMMNGPSGGQGALGGFGGSNGGVTGGAGEASGAAGGTAPGNGGNGSGGGGSSDVRRAAGGCAALNCALSDRVLVGGGGGGGGGVGGQGNAIGGAGGDGGGATGANGGALRSTAATLESRAAAGPRPRAGPVDSTPGGTPVARIPTIRVTAVMAPMAPPARAVSGEPGTCPAPASRTLPAQVARTPPPRVVAREAAQVAGTSVAVAAPVVVVCSVVLGAPVVAEQAAAPSPQQPSLPPP